MNWGVFSGGDQAPWGQEQWPCEERLNIQDLLSLEREGRMEAGRNPAAEGGPRFSLKHMARKQKTGHKLNLKVWCGEKEVTMSIMKQWNKCDQSWRFSGTGKALRNLLWIQC